MKKQSALQLRKDVNGEGSVLHASMMKKISIFLLNLFVIDIFMEYTSALKWKFRFPSRTKVIKDITNYYIE